MYLTYSTKTYYSALALFLITMLTVNIINAQQQQDTVYYNAKWRVSVKDSASFFRPPIKKTDELYEVKDYFISGQLQMKGFSQSAKKDIWEGITTWYNKDGSVHQQGIYVNGKLEGDFITFLKDEKLVAKYKNGRFFAGKQNIIYTSGAKYFKEYRNDTIVEITYENDLEDIRFERYSKAKEYDVLVKYYGEKGVFLGERTKRSNGSYEGIEVFYYYNPMRIRTINYFKRGIQFATSGYYPNGKPRELFSETPELTKTFYDKSGEVIGKMIYQADQYGLKPFRGTLVNFMYGSGEKAYKRTSKISYELGKKTEDIVYYENQQIKTKTIFKSEGKIHQQIGFDEEGNEISRMEYKNYTPFNGTEIFTDRKATYEEGKLIEETTYYTNTKQVFSIKSTNEEKYYDTKGKLLGTLELSNAENYPKPLNGTRYYKDYYGGISSFEKYKDGYVIERTSFRDRKIGENNIKKTFKKIETYRLGTYDKIKEVNYYSNGVLQAERTFEKYVEQDGIYYDENGELLGRYDFTKKEGTRYQFFPDSDVIEQIEELKAGKRIRFKKYTYGSNRRYGAIDPVLVQDIDVNCCASFYDRNGELIASVVVKDEKPWSGTLYDPISFEKFRIEKGKREGEYQKLDYNMSLLVIGTYLNDKRNGVFTSYTATGEVKSTENYKDDKLNGLSTYYDDEGGVIGKMLYKDDLPIEGTRTVSGYYGTPLTTENYADGKLLEKIEFWDKGKRVTTFKDDNSSKTIVFYPDSKLKRLTFSSKYTTLHGKVTYYDKLGNVQTGAEIKDGRLISGTIYLIPIGGDNNMKYYKLTNGKDTVELVIYGEDDKVLFKAEEHLYFGTATYYLQNLNIRIEYLASKNLY